MKKLEDQVIVCMIVLTPSSERIFNLMRYTGSNFCIKTYKRRDLQDNITYKEVGWRQKNINENSKRKIGVRRGSALKIPNSGSFSHWRSLINYVQIISNS